MNVYENATMMTTRIPRPVVQMCVTTTELAGGSFVTAVVEHNTRERCLPHVEHRVPRPMNPRTILYAFQVSKRCNRDGGRVVNDFQTGFLVVVIY